MERCSKCGGLQVVEVLDTVTTLKLTHPTNAKVSDAKIVTFTIEASRCTSCGKRVYDHERRYVGERAIVIADERQHNKGVSKLSRAAARKRHDAPASGGDGDMAGSKRDSQ